ncbi:MAG: cytochrome c [Nonlabens sp.]
MIQPLAKIAGYVFGFLICSVLVVFGTTFLIVNSQAPSVSQTQIIDAPLKPAVELTDTAKMGKEFFKTNCAACHKLFKKAVGPALHNVAEKYDREWLYKWIKNSSALIRSGDPQAVAVYEEYDQANMNAFPQLTNENIDHILEYTSVPKP